MDPFSSYLARGRVVLLAERMLGGGRQYDLALSN